jgi:hypothetical protein
MRFPRAIQVARALSGLAPEHVAVVCADEPEAADPDLGAIYPDGARHVVRVPWTAPWLGYRRMRDRLLEHRMLVPDRFRPWLRPAAGTIRGGGLLARADALVTFGQPMSTHLLGLRLRRRPGVPWIAHFSDPWVDSPFRHASGTTTFLNRRLERAVLQEADLVVYTSEETVDLVARTHGDVLRAKVRVLPHSFDSELYPRVPDRHGPIVARYLGAFYGHRGPTELLAALRALQAHEPETTARLRVELVGSREHPLDPSLLAGLPDGLVTVREPVSYLDSLRLMRESDILLVLDASAEQSVFLPSKLVDYIGARRTIVALTPPGPAARLVARYGGGVADPADPSASAEVLGRAVEAAGSRRDTDVGDPAVVASYAQSVVAAAFADLVAEAVA